MLAHSEFVRNQKSINQKCVRPKEHGPKLILWVQLVLLTGGLKYGKYILGGWHHEGEGLVTILFLSFSYFWAEVLVTSEGALL